MCTYIYTWTWNRKTYERLLRNNNIWGWLLLLRSCAHTCMQHKYMHIHTQKKDDVLGNQSSLACLEKGILNSHVWLYEGDLFKEMYYQVNFFLCDPLPKMWTQCRLYLLVSWWRVIVGASKVIEHKPDAERSDYHVLFKEKFKWDNR